MKLRATLALFLAAGCPAAMAQEEFLVHYSWQEVFAGSITPATGPLAGNSILDPGEGARIRLGITALINGTNAVGQTSTYSNPAPGGIGTVRGIGTVVYDLLGDGNQPSAFGSWNHITAGPGGFIPPNPPQPQPGGASIFGFGGGEFIAPGSTANNQNNNREWFRGTWNPASYAHRTVNFLARQSILVPAGQGNSVLLAYGTGTGIDPTTGAPFNYDLLVGKYFGSDFGQVLNIPIAPAPASLAILGLAWLLRSPRRPHV